MSSQITKLVLVPLEEWKHLNKNGGGGEDTYTTIEIPSSKPRNQEERGVQKTRRRLRMRCYSSSSSSSSKGRKRNAKWDDEELGLLPLPLPLLPPPAPPPSSSSSSPPPLREEVARGGEGEGKGEGRVRRGIEIIRNVGNRPPGKRVTMKILHFYFIYLAVIVRFLPFQ